MVKGAWWHSAHCLFCFQARLSFARKVSPRLIVSLTLGTGSAAAPIGRTIRVTTAERRRMTNLQALLARTDKQVGGRWGRYQVDSTRPAGWPPANRKRMGPVCKTGTTFQITEESRSARSLVRDTPLRSWRIDMSARLPLFLFV